MLSCKCNNEPHLLRIVSHHGIHVPRYMYTTFSLQFYVHDVCFLYNTIFACLVILILFQSVVAQRLPEPSTVQQFAPRARSVEQLGAQAVSPDQTHQQLWVCFFQCALCVADCGSFVTYMYINCNSTCIFLLPYISRS